MPCGSRWEDNRHPHKKWRVWWIGRSPFQCWAAPDPWCSEKPSELGQIDGSWSFPSRFGKPMSSPEGEAYSQACLQQLLRYLRASSKGVQIRSKIPQFSLVRASPQNRKCLSKSSKLFQKKISAGALHNFHCWPEEAENGWAGVGA